MTVEVAVLDCPSLIVLMVTVDVTEATFEEEEEEEEDQSSGAV